MNPTLNKNILLVEDEKVTHHAICKAFKQNEYSYTGVMSLTEAMKMIKTERFDIIFSDITLPDGSGLDLLDEVHRCLIRTPIVMITASDNKTLVQHALEKGAADFLSKPFNLDNIPTIIDRNLQRQRIEQQRHNPRNARVLLRAIKALISALEAKDSYTSGHSIRVAHFAKVVGQCINMDDDQLFTLQLSAVLHDIGKIGLPDTILKKESDLCFEEYNEVKEHTLIGSRIVGHIEELTEVAAIIRHHHERWDGSGYPDGLQGQAIPIMARILSIVDTYEAIVSRRTYSQARNENHAIDEIKKHSGKQFDPVLVDIFQKALQRPDFHAVEEDFFTQF